MPLEAEIYYQLYKGCEEGVRPPIIMIHGAGGNILHWHPQLRRIPNQRVYAIDLPGHGKSPGRGQQTIQGYSESVLAWMEVVNIHSAVFVGHSMGSAISLDITLSYPKHASGLVLIGSGVRLPVNPGLIEATSNETTYHKAVEQIITWSFSPNTSQQIKLLAEERMAETRPSVLNGDFMACNAFDVTEEISRIYRPTLILCGADDKMTPPRRSQYLADNITDAQIGIIPNAGHMVILEQPSAVASYINEFLPAIIY